MGTPITDLPVELDAGDLQTRYIELGDMAIRHARVPAGTDMGPVLQGLPGDRCPSPHWGIVLEGSIAVLHADGTSEVASAGEVYHWPAGHTAVSDGGCTFLEVGPVEPMRRFSEHAMGCWQAGDAGHRSGNEFYGAGARRAGCHAFVAVAVRCLPSARHQPPGRRGHRRGRGGRRAAGLGAARGRGRLLRPPRHRRRCRPFTSLALDATSSPVVSYYNASDGDLKVLNCDDQAVSTRRWWTPEAPTRRCAAKPSR